MITFTIEADYVKDHFPKDLCHSCFHAAYIEIPPGWNGHFTVSIRPRACFSPSYNKVKSQTKHVWLLTLL